MSIIEYTKELYKRGLAPVHESIDVENLNDAEAVCSYFTLRNKGIIVGKEPPYRTILRACIHDMEASQQEKEKVYECLWADHGRLIPDTFGIANRLLRESRTLGDGSCVTREFERVSELYEERVADRKYKQVVLLVDELRTPSWLEPATTSFELRSYGSVTRNSMFGVDFSLANEYLKGLGLIPVCDGSVRSMLLQPGFTASHPKYLEIFNHVQFVGIRVMRRLVNARNDVVWVSSGSQFGCPMHYRETRMSDFYPDGRLLCIASGSMLNQGYGGIQIYRFHANSYKSGGFGEEVVSFKDGKMQ